jgi:uncharacterized protein YndB with AHSA1/START domain
MAAKRNEKGDASNSAPTNTPSSATGEGSFVIERVFDAPVALVWQAITDKDAIKQWSFDMKGFEPVVGCEFEFTGEKDGVVYVHRSVVKEVIPQKKFAYSWRYEGYAGDSLVTMELFPEGNKTRFKLTHDGLDSFPPLPKFARENFAAGWMAIVGSLLKAFVEKDGAGTADRQIVTTRVFDTPRELVFEAWTDPQHVAQWWGPNGFTNTIHEMDVRAGGVWRFVMHGPNGVDYQNKNVFVEVVKPERLVFDHVSGPKFQMTVMFEDLDGKTRLTMRMVFETAAEHDKVVKEFGAIEGAKQTLGRLAQFLGKV